MILAIILMGQVASATEYKIPELIDPAPTEGIGSFTISEDILRKGTLENYVFRDDGVLIGPLGPKTAEIGLQDIPTDKKDIIKKEISSAEWHDCKTVKVECVK